LKLASLITLPTEDIEASDPAMLVDRWSVVANIGVEIDSTAKGVPKNLVIDAVLGSGDEWSIALMFAVDIPSESHDPVRGDTRRGSVMSQREQRPQSILGSIF
jgi:hypothetical protein